MNEDQRKALYVGGGVAGVAVAFGAYKLISGWTHVQASSLEYTALNQPSVDYVMVLLSQKWAAYSDGGGYPDAPNPGTRDVTDYPVTSFAQADAVYQAWLAYAGQLVASGATVGANIPLFSVDNVAGSNPYSVMYATMEAVSESIYSRIQANTLVEFDNFAYANPTLATYTPDDPDGGVLTYDEAKMFWDGMAVAAFTIDGAASAPVPTDSTMEYFAAGLGSLIGGLPSTVAAMIAGATSWAAHVVSGAFSGVVLGTITGLLAAPLGLLAIAGLGTWFAWKHYEKQPKSLSGKETIYEALRRKLGREPTNAELKADVERIKEEGLIERATAGKLQHQRRRR